MNILEHLRNITQSSDGKIMLLFLLLLWVMVFDLISGIISAYINKKANSKVGINGILRKIVVALSTLTLVITSVIIPEGEAFVITSLIGLLVMELLSIVENGKKANIKEVKFLKDLVDLLTKKK